MKTMGASNRNMAPNQVTAPVMVPHPSWHRFPTMRYVLSVSLVILSTYLILLQLANILPRKTVVDLSCGSRKQLCKMSACKHKITKAQSGSSTSTSKHAHTIINKTPNEEVLMPGSLSHNSSLMSIESLTRKVSSIVCSLFDLFDLDVQPAGKRNPIYHFYESVSMNSHGEVGNPGDRHYKCHHGTRKVITVTHAMKYSVNGNNLSFFVQMSSQTSIAGLVGHLKTHFQAMYRLYVILKDRTEPPTPDDLGIASGTKVLDAEVANAYLGRVEAASANLLSMFARQSHENAASII